MTHEEVMRMHQEVLKQHREVFAKPDPTIAPAKKGLEIKPDFAAMFRTMIEDAGRQGVGLLFARLTDRAMRAEALRDVQRWFAPLTIAANAASNPAEMERLRDVMAAILSEIDQTAYRIESEEA